MPLKWLAMDKINPALKKWKHYVWLLQVGMVRIEFGDERVMPVTYTLSQIELSNGVRRWLWIPDDEDNYPNIAWHPFSRTQNVREIIRGLHHAEYIVLAACPIRIPKLPKLYKK